MQDSQIVHAFTVANVGLVFFRERYIIEQLPPCLSFLPSASMAQVNSFHLNHIGHNIVHAFRHFITINDSRLGMSKSHEYFHFPFALEAIHENIS